MKRIIIASIDDNWLIGKGDTIPWRLSEDMKWFKETTSGSSVLMGRKTWDSLPKKPLPNRINIVITRYSSLDDAIIFDSVEKGLEYVADLPKVFIIGGAEIYRYCLENNLVDMMYISHVKGTHDGGIYFPQFDKTKWEQTIIKQFAEFSIIQYEPHK